MSKICARGSAVSLAVLFIAFAVLAQELEKKTPVPAAPRADCESNSCVSKVLYLPDFSAAYELQDLVNTFRVTAHFTNIYPKQSDHTLALIGTLEQLDVAEKLLSVLGSLHSSGGHDRSSVLVYQLKGGLSGTAESERVRTQHPRAASTVCELTTCYIEAFYLPDLSEPQLQDFINRVRTTADIAATGAIPSRHIFVIRGTSEQVAIAEMLCMGTSTPQ